jgi:hypothetical protein
MTGKRDPLLKNFLDFAEGLESRAPKKRARTARLMATALPAARIISEHTRGACLFSALDLLRPYGLAKDRGAIHRVTLGLRRFRPIVAELPYPTKPKIFQRIQDEDFIRLLRESVISWEEKSRETQERLNSGSLRPQERRLLEFIGRLEAKLAASEAAALEEFEKMPEELKIAVAVAFSEEHPAVHDAARKKMEMAALFSRPAVRESAALELAEAMERQKNPMKPLSGDAKIG